jgi:thiamine-monophosphate kinase
LRAGDELFVTGVLGAAALARHRADRRRSRLTRVAVPRLAIGQQLARSATTSACIDLSDGLATDLAHLLAPSKLGAEIECEALPLARGFARACRELGLDPGQLAVTGGEDYELLFACRPGRRRSSSVVGIGGHAVPVRRIGHVTKRAGIRGLPPMTPTPHHF